MIPETPKSSFQLEPDRMRELATTIAERFDPKTNSGEDVALAANISLGLVAAAAELERLREVESQVDKIKAVTMKFLYAAAKSGDALATLVLRDEQRRRSRESVEGPLRELFTALDKAMERSAANGEETGSDESPDPKSRPEPSQPQPQPAA